MMEQSTAVGVIGLGNMGGGMAASLIRSGQTVWGYDLSPDACRRARADGVRITTSLADLAARCDTVFTVLPDSADVRACYLSEDGLVAQLRPGTWCVDCSTIEPALTDEVAARVVDAGAHFADAALGRSPAEARAGELLFMVGADAATLEQLNPLLEAMGNVIQHCGGVGTGIRTKLVLNLLSQATCQLSAEALALGLKMGLEREALLSVMGAGLGSNGFVTRYWPTKVLAGDTTPGFAIRLSAKDMRYAVSMAERAGAPIPTGAAAAAAINAAAERHGDKDVSGLLLVACENARTQL